ncbi:MAG: hypothetical protein NVS9B7_20880 [Flavisolibacter sp.]
MAKPTFDKEDQEYIDKAKSKYAYHAAQAERYEAILKAFGISMASNELIDVSTKLPHKNGAPVISEINPIKTTKYDLRPGFTFIDFVEKLLKEQDKPMLTTQIRDEFIRLTGNEIKLTNFSSKLNMRQKRTGRIKNVIYSELPLARRGWWGLPSWFTKEGGLKREYRLKIPDFNTVDLTLMNLITK